jgi:cytochrome c oxidase subunit 2
VSVAPAPSRPAGVPVTPDPEPAGRRMVEYSATVGDAQAAVVARGGAAARRRRQEQVVARDSGGRQARPGARRGPLAGRVAGLAVGGIGALLALAGCSFSDTFHGFGWPREGVTPQAHRMYDLWIGSVVAALAVGFFVWGLIFWCVLRYRKRGDELPPQTRYNLPIEILYTVVPFLVIAVLFYYTAVTQTYVNKVSQHPDVKVEVVAYKWNWQFRYLENNVTGADGAAVATKGPDGQDVSTVGASDYVPVLVVPTHKRILFYETSRDVIHSFWVPDLLFKRDVLPGNVTNSFEVTIDKEGAYVGRCAEFCGAYHSMMNFEVRAVSAEDFARYLTLRTGGMSTPEALLAIGQKSGLATTTQPFDTDQGKRNAP